MHSEENDQKPQIWPFRLIKITLKRGVPTDRDQNLISCERCQDTPACQISGYSKWLQ